VEAVAEAIAIGPSHYYESALAAGLATPGVVHAVLERQDAFDAVIVGCFADPGVRAAREVARVPVIGPGEAVYALVQTIAARFGIVTIVEPNVPEIALALRGFEIASKCVGIDAIGLPFHALLDDPADTLARLEGRARPQIERGAEAIVLGCMSFGVHPFAAELQERIGVPVVDALRAAVSVARAHALLGVRPVATQLADLTHARDHLRALERASTVDALRADRADAATVGDGAR
jgi:allantoin racemase